MMQAVGSCVMGHTSEEAGRRRRQPSAKMTPASTSLRRPVRTASAVRAELDRLLERRSVGPAHRVGDETRNELDALVRGVRAPLVRVGALLGRQTPRGAL